MNPSAQGEPSSDGSPPTDADQDRETRTYPVLESQTASAHRIGVLAHGVTTGSGRENAVVIVWTMLQRDPHPHQGAGAPGDGDSVTIRDPRDRVLITAGRRGTARHRAALRQCITGYFMACLCPIRADQSSGTGLQRSSGGGWSSGYRRVRA